MQFDTSDTTYFGNDEFLVSVVLLLLEFLRAEDCCTRSTFSHYILGSTCVRIRVLHSMSLQA